MTQTYITAIGISNPPYKINQQQTSAFMSKALNLNESETRKLRLLYRASSIQNRYSVLDDYNKTEDFCFYPNDDGFFPTTSQRMQLYKANACPLAVAAVKDALKGKEQDGLKKITHLITVSCTGMYAPGLDIELVGALALNPAVKRTCVNFMGCYASFNALKIADNICRSEPEAVVLVVAVELCTLHLQKSNLPDDWLANALFADGAAAVLLESKPNDAVSLQLKDFHCDLAPNGKEDMAWEIGDFGFEMKLSNYVPDLLQTKIKDLVNNLLKRLNLTISDIENFAIHPGGKKILEVIERSLGLSKESNSSAYEILRNYGNMSSVTVLFVLKNILEKLGVENHQEKVLSMAFGPGLTLESALMEVHCPS